MIHLNIRIESSDAKECSLVRHESRLVMMNKGATSLILALTCCKILGISRGGNAYARFQSQFWEMASIASGDLMVFPCCEDNHFWHTP